MGIATGVHVSSSWIIVDCDLSERIDVDIAIGRPENWHPALRDVINGERVAKIRIPRNAPVGHQAIYLRWDGQHEQLAGTARLRHIPRY